MNRLLLKALDLANRYLVNLKGSDEIGAEAKYLKGVLVLRTQKGSKERVQAFDIDSPIEEDGDPHILSLLDPSISFFFAQSVAVRQLLTER